MRASITGESDRSQGEVSITDFGGEKRKDISDIDQAVEDVMAMVRGKGKGRGTRECYNCKKT